MKLRADTFSITAVIPGGSYVVEQTVRHIGPEQKDSE